MIKILTILGARPQFIKSNSVSKCIYKDKNIQEIIVHTGQHYDSEMSHVFFEEMNLSKPDYFLGIGNKSHATMTGQMMSEIEKIAIKEKPDCMLVYGDTNSTLAGAIVASKLNIKLAHIEAGLRSFNMNMPEEINRVLTDRVSDILFCPTTRAIDNLKNEGYDKFNCKIIKTGDVMKDNAIFYDKLAIKPNHINIDNGFILSTIHRAENVNNTKKIKEIFRALNIISKDKQIILPLHPKTKQIIQNLNIDTGNLTITKPMGYLNIIWLIKNCEFVITDSGGIQKEAYFFEKKCITIRDETEWVELVENGVNILVEANASKIIKTVEEITAFDTEKTKLNLYGDGNAGQFIVKELFTFLLGQEKDNY